jgi:predicted transcriptional regulator
VQQKVESPEMVDLVDIDDDEKYEDFKSKQQAELIRQQQLAEATKPSKLAEFQCIICMDNPTDLTVTHCGMWLSPSL